MSKGTRKALPETVARHIAGDPTYGKEMFEVLSPFFKEQIKDLLREQLATQATPVVPKVASVPHVSKATVVSLPKVAPLVPAPSIKAAREKKERLGVDIMPELDGDGEIFVNDNPRGPTVNFLTVDANGESSAPVEALDKLIQELAQKAGIRRYGWAPSRIFGGGYNGANAGHKGQRYLSRDTFIELCRRWAETGATLDYVSV